MKLKPFKPPESGQELEIH